jgi:molybdopterin molybdotransferase
MSQQVSALLAVETARDAVLEALGAALPAEIVAVDRALGRVLAETVTAATSLPPWDNSAMDGYAIRSSDTSGAVEDAPVRLEVVGEVAAGRAWEGPALTTGRALRIATGAPLPAGADAVVAVEETTSLGKDGDPAGSRGRVAAGPLPAGCAVHIELPPGANVRRRGSDLEAGQELLGVGEVVGPAAVGLIAGAGVPRVAVYRRPRVAVLATGDEVRQAGEALGDAGIPDANGPGLRALVSAAGAEPIDLGIARDDLAEVVARLRGALAEADAIVVSGGVSVGPYDVVKLAFELIGQVDLWRVAVQPGKPFAFGSAVRPDAGAGRPERVPLFGLPGNPVSGFVTFELFVRPALRRLGGHREILRPTDRGVLLDPTDKSQGRRAFLRAVAERDEDGLPSRDADGRVRLRLAGGQGSHVLSALAVAEALAIVPEPLHEVPAGTPVGVWWLDR